MAVEKIRLCPGDALAEGESRGFSIPVPSGVLDIFLVRKAGQVVAYLNRCPHTGGPLDWVPDRFLDLDGTLIQCATHDARFRIEDGFCVAGPCSGASLTPVALEFRDGDIFCATCPTVR